jgi:Fe-S cluster biogenesis protein NfuA
LATPPNPVADAADLEAVDLHAVAHRIEQLLEALQGSAGARVWSQIEEMVRALTDLYGAGLTRTVELAERHRGGGGQDLFEELAADELVASLLVLHGIHPQSLEVRAERAVASAAPGVLARGGELRLVAVDAESGMVEVLVTAREAGCGSDPGSLGGSVREILADALPDARTIDVGIEVDQMPVETPVRLSRKRAPAGAGP